MSWDLTWPRDQRVIWHHEWVSVIISQYPAKFCCNKPWRRGDILLLIGHVILHDHVVNGFCGIMGGCLSFYATTTQVLCQFFLKIHNWLVMTCVDLWTAFLTYQWKRAFWLQTQARTSNLNFKRDHRASEYCLNDK